MVVLQFVDFLLFKIDIFSNVSANINIFNHLPLIEVDLRFIIKFKFMIIYFFHTIIPKEKN